VLFAIGVADVAISCSRIVQELCTLAVSFPNEGFHNGVVATLHAIPAYLGLLNCLTHCGRLTGPVGGLPLRRRTWRAHEEKKEGDARRKND
jgi:hypothetical protein